MGASADGRQININQNIYLTQPFLLLPSQNAGGNNMGDMGQGPQNYPGQMNSDKQVSSSQAKAANAQSKQQELMPPPQQRPAKEIESKQ